MAQQEWLKALMRRATTVRTTSIVGAGALILGIVIGGGASDTDPRESRAYLTLQSNFETASEDRNALAAENEEMRNAQEAMVEDQARLTSDLEGLESRLADVEQREQAVAAAEAELVEVAPPAAQPAPAPAPISEPAPAPAPPTATYYDNCTAARDAGATPVRDGDPGYGPHLDRDGDGVACE